MTDGVATKVLRTSPITAGLTLRSTGRAGTQLLAGGHRRGPPVGLYR